MINLSRDFNWSVTVANIQADGNGAFSATITVPQGALIGPTYIDAIDESGSHTGEAPFTVTSEIASKQLLTLPFPSWQNTTTGDTSMGLQQGWIYTAPLPPGCNHDPTLHCGIDYIERTIDNSSTWQHFPVVAAYDGEACGDNESGGACVTGLGKKVLIRHTLPNGTIVYSYYGHLNWIAPWIPIGNRNTQSMSHAVRKLARLVTQEREDWYICILH